MMTVIVGHIPDHDRHQDLDLAPTHIAGLAAVLVVPTLDLEVVHIDQGHRRGTDQRAENQLQSGHKDQGDRDHHPEGKHRKENQGERVGRDPLVIDLWTVQNLFLQNK